MKGGLFRPAAERRYRRKCLRLPFRGDDIKAERVPRFRFWTRISLIEHFCEVLSLDAGQTAREDVFKRVDQERSHIANAEIAGLLAKVDGYSAAPKAAQEALPSPRRLDFGISGIVVSPSSDRPDRAGVLVAAVSTESVAHQAGIITGDIICQVGDRPTRSLADLEAAVAAIPAHASAAVRIYRGLKEVTLSARF